MLSPRKQAATQSELAILTKNEEIAHEQKRLKDAKLSVSFSEERLAKLLEELAHLEAQAPSEQPAEG